MNLPKMRELFRKHTASLASDIDDPGVDEYLNRAYRFMIPLDIGGEFTEDIWVLTLEVDKIEYDLPENVISSSGKTPWIETKLDEMSQEVAAGLYYLSVDTDPVVFKRKHLNHNHDSRPTGVLFYGKKLQLNALPSERFIMHIPVRGGPINPLVDAGLSHDTHAMAVIMAASVEYLTETEDLNDAGLAKANELFKRYRGQLRTYSHSRPMERRPTRSF